MKSSTAQKLILLTLLVFLFASYSAYANNIQKVQRGLHEDFELFVFYCDTLPTVKLEYNRVIGECRIEFTNLTISEEALKDLNLFGMGISVNRTIVEDDAEAVVFLTRSSVRVTPYIVNGPPALMIDFSIVNDVHEILPYELERNAYMTESNLAEQAGNLSLALKYLEHISKIGEGAIEITHKAGVLQHKLGRFELALETFSQSSSEPHLLPDAAARRAMIYLAMGDTLASGKEWSGYFHQVRAGIIDKDNRTIQKPIEPVAKLPKNIDKPTQSATNQNESLAAPFNLEFSRNATIIGGVIFFVGLTLLIVMLASARKDDVLEVDFKQAYLEERNVEKFNLDAIPKRRTLRVTPESSTDKETVNMTKTVNRMAKAYQTVSNDAKTAPQAISNTPNRRVIVDSILKMSYDGKSELEIANSLLVSRDEVAMVLNLAKLAEEKARAN